MTSWIETGSPSPRCSLPKLVVLFGVSLQICPVALGGEGHQVLCRIGDVLKITVCQNRALHETANQLSLKTTMCQALCQVLGGPTSKTDPHPELLRFTASGRNRILQSYLILCSIMSGQCLEIRAAKDGEPDLVWGSGKAV